VSAFAVLVPHHIMNPLRVSLGFILHRCFVRVGALFFGASLVLVSPVAAEEPPATLIGTQTVGLVAGGMLPVRLLEPQSSKLNGVAVHPSWQITLTDPIGGSWWSGTIALGAEAAFLGVTEPTGAYGVGFTPKLVYTFTSFGRLKPYIEGGGGPLWTNFDGRIREQGSDFNFLVWGGTSVSYDLTTHWALNIGVRFSHISNSGLYAPNSGLNYLLPFAGVSARIF
jgi:lipid A 3-O-deacylase